MYMYSVKFKLGFCRQSCSYVNVRAKFYEWYIYQGTYTHWIVFASKSYLTENDTFSGQEDIEVAIDSIIAIPAEQWDIEIIEPKFQCVRILQTCIGSTFFSPAGSQKVEFESGSLPASLEIPPNIVDTSIKVIKMDGNAVSFARYPQKV